MFGFSLVSVKMTDKCTCCLCESKFDEWDIKHIEIKDKVKDIERSV